MLCNEHCLDKKGNFPQNIVMEERNAHNPKGVDVGARRVASQSTSLIKSFHDESILTAISSTFTGGADGTSYREAFMGRRRQETPKKKQPECKI